MLRTQGTLGPFPSPEEVHGEWHRGDAPILQARLFEEHGRPLGLDETVSDASCFKVDVHRATYPQELTTTVEVSNPPLQRAPRHGCTSLTDVLNPWLRPAIEPTAQPRL